MTEIPIDIKWVASEETRRDSYKLGKVIDEGDPLAISRVGISLHINKVDDSHYFTIFYNDLKSYQQYHQQIIKLLKSRYTFSYVKVALVVEDITI